MKLGTQTASLVNHLHARGVIGQPEPVVGMGATILRWTDRSAATIVEVFKVGALTFIAIQEDNAKMISGSGHDGSADYEFTPNPDTYKSFYRREKDGMWSEVRLSAESKRWAKTGGAGLRIGERDKYHDPSF